MNLKDFYKQLNPSQFSDSIIVKKAELDRDMFAYFLDKLTHESREKEFEIFCKSIIEHTITPNLLPQTGPTGGGDSKVDSETIPVSDSIAETWFYGYNDSSHTERWAFAFSATKNWKQKFESDIKKIIKTNEDLERGYSKIFFVTNQFVSDRNRAKSEDEARKLYGLDIRIFDKNWLLEKTFDEGNELCAVKAFNLSESLLEKKEIGSRDYTRLKRKSEIENKLTNTDSLKPSQIINLSQEYITILRETETDKNNMIAALDRNERLAYKYGDFNNKIDALYDYCWTLYWWYEDIELVYNYYLKLENLFLENKNYYAFTKTNIIFTVLNTYSNENEGVLTDIQTHKTLINDIFNSYINDTENRVIAEKAFYDYQKFNLTLGGDTSEVVSNYINILNDLLPNTEINLNEFSDVLELGILEKEEKFDELFELLLSKLQEQSKNNSASNLLLKRGDKLLENNDIYNAIEFYSRSLSMIIDGDSKTILLRTLLKLGISFNTIGLKWAARSYFLKAFTYSFSYYFDKGIVQPSLFLSLRQLKYLALENGDIKTSLWYNELENISQNLYPYEQDNYDNDQSLSYDYFLSSTFLHLEETQLKFYERLPDYLERWGLMFACAGLKFKLGYYDDNLSEALGNHEAIDEFFKNLYQRKFPEVTYRALNSSKKNNKYTLKSKVSGCNITIKTDKNSFAYEFGASLLSMIENLFATSIQRGVITSIKNYNFNISLNLKDSFEIDIIHKNNNRQNISLSVLNEAIDNNVLQNKYFEIMSNFISDIIDFEEVYHNLIDDVEYTNSLFRIINFSSNIAFEQESIKLDNESYLLYSNKQEIVRFKGIEGKIKKSITKKDNDTKKDKIKFSFENDINHFSTIRHDKIEIVSVIDNKAWNKAKWNGILALAPLETSDELPVIGLIFDNNSGTDIFKDWRNSKVGNELTIGFLTHINKHKPLDYRVIIGNKIEEVSFNNSDNQVITHSTRIHTMDPKSNDTINTIRLIKKEFKNFYLVPFSKKQINNFSGYPIKNKTKIKLSTEAIILKNMNNIDENDLFLSSGIRGIDKPITEDNVFLNKLIRSRKDKE